MGRPGTWLFLNSPGSLPTAVAGHGLHQPDHDPMSRDRPSEARWVTGGRTAGTGGVLASQGPWGLAPTLLATCSVGAGGLGGASFRPQLLAQVGLGEMTT